MSLETIDKWFLREVMRWRCGAAIAWSVLCVPVMSALYITLANLQPLHPLTCIADTSSCILSSSFISSVTVIMIVTGCFQFYTKNTYSVLPTVSISRVSHLAQLLIPSILTHIALCTGSGLVVAWIMTCLLGDRYAGLSTQQHGTYTVNEYHIFLVLYGGYTGLMFTVSHYIHHGNLVVFPHTQQGKFAEARCQLIPTARAALGHVLWQIKYFYLLYFLSGEIFQDFIASTLSLKYGPGPRLDSLYGLLDVGLFWQALLVGVFIQLTWTLGALLYKLYNTEGYEFPISTMFETFQNKCLVDALTCTKLPLLQALGFQDLTKLSQHSYVRRRELFSLSQPGGHPHNWNKISSVCLSVINELSDSVQEVNWKILASAPVRQNNNTEKAGVTTTHSNGETTVEGENKSTVRERIINGIKKRKVLTFFTWESTESRSKSLFVSAYVQIWAVEALAWLVKVSVTEDLFGVVQMSLSDIISAVLSLHENVEKHLKLTGGVARRGQRDTMATTETLYKHQLQTALKSSVYMIVNTFGSQLLEVGLSPDTEKKLHQFLEYRE
ncbi:nucleoporin NDC1-like isoform X2 [Dreissena polymorpha]|uniref:Nucleoporin NDC1 n=1 Tax=Dreissena polymorpha TaxID=45954 RepID=A0A9D4CWD4_DREPO|nr:nucleoporin NDC1-like isoform X2 [Dreissena polymorpha]KAH3733610.1 hypothetical protein DPMN_040042 [Dreissena polymorpha]